MQKLKRSKSENGSTLLGAVVISLIMAIGAAGLMVSVRNVSNNEADSLDDAKAFLAAESGLLTLTDYVMRAGTTEAAKTDSTTINIDGIPVTIGIKKPAGSTITDNFWLLYSIANHSQLPYKKRLEWRVELKPPVNRSLGDYAAVVNAVSNIGIVGHAFHGPSHFNTPVVMGRNQTGTQVRFFGDVTVYMDEENSKGRGIGGYGTSPNGRNNNYNEGLVRFSDVGEGLTENAAGYYYHMDNIMQEKFSSGANEMRVDFRDNALPNNIDKRILVSNATSNTLEFRVNSGTPEYRFNSTADDGWTPYIQTIPLYLEVSGPLTVSGNTTMLGNVTVRTTESYDITIDLSAGNLTYDWAPTGTGNTDANINYSYANFTDETLNRPNNNNSTTTIAHYDQLSRLGTYNEREDLLTFYSGGNINLKSDGTPTTSTNEADRIPTRTITAQLIAVNESKTIKHTAGNLNKPVAVIGTAAVDEFWNLTDRLDRKVIRTYQDKRGLSGPGIVLVDGQGNIICEGCGGGDTAYDLNKKHWREINCANKAGACPPEPQ